MREGIIVAICTSSLGELTTFPRASVTVMEHGFWGDRHCNPTRRSHRDKKRFKENDRHLLVLAQEALDDVGRKLGLMFVPGMLGENVTISGLGDLSDLAPGNSILLGREGNEVHLVVTEQATPCHKLLPLHRLLPTTIHGRRGVYCVVKEGAGQTLHPGDPVFIL